MAMKDLKRILPVEDDPKEVALTLGALSDIHNQFQKIAEFFPYRGAEPIPAYHAVRG